MGAFGNTFGDSFGTVGLTRNYNIAIDPDLAMWARGRSGLTLPDSLGNNPSILPAFLSITSETQKVYVADNGSLDIGSQDFTMCMWLKNDDNYSGYWYYGGKSVTGGINGMYSILSYPTTGYLRAYIQSSGGAVNIISTQQATTGSWFHCRIDVNQVTKKCRFFINNIQIGSDTTFTGTFASMNNVYEFILGAANSVNGSTISSTAKSSYSDVFVFHRLLSDEEALTIYNRGVVTGSAAHYPLLGVSGLLTTVVKYQYDASGNNLHLICDSVSGHEILTSDFKYDSRGSQHGLNVGYTLYENANNQIYVPFTDTGAELSSPPGLTGYTKTANFTGDSSFHNLSNSEIGFIGSEWDRSDTTIWKSTTRATTTYYNSTNITTKKFWHVIELSNIHLSNWSNSGYERKIAVKISDNSYGARRKLEEIMVYTTNKNTSDFDGVLTYCLDTNLTRSKTIQLSTTQGITPVNSAIGYIIDSGKSVFISFGDGYFIKCNANGTYQASSHTHSVGSTTYEVRILGDLNGLGKCVIADQLMNVNISEFGKATNLWWLGSGITRTLVGSMDDLPACFKEIWFRYPAIDGVGITGNLNLKPLLEAFEMQGGSATPEQYFVKNVTGDFANITKMKNWCCVSRVGGDVSLLTDIEYFSWNDYYGQATIHGDISNLTHLWSYETQTGGESVTGDTTLLIDMEQFKGNFNMTLPASVNHMPKLSSFQPYQQLSATVVNQYLADFRANREVPRVHLKNTIAEGTGYRLIDLSVNPGTVAPTGQGLVDKAFLQSTVSPASPGNGTVWTVLTK